eukprot:1996-Pelagococcus_subviridis.AAC.5
MHAKRREARRLYPRRRERGDAVRPRLRLLDDVLVPRDAPHLYHVIHRPGREHDVAVHRVRVGRLEVQREHFVAMPPRSREHGDADARVDVPQPHALVLTRADEQVRRERVRADVVHAVPVPADVFPHALGGDVDDAHDAAHARDGEQGVAHAARFAPRAGEERLVLARVHVRLHEFDVAVRLRAIYRRAVRAHGREDVLASRGHVVELHRVEILRVIFLDLAREVVPPAPRRAGVGDAEGVRGGPRVLELPPPVRFLAVRHRARRDDAAARARRRLDFFSIASSRSSTDFSEGLPTKVCSRSVERGHDQMLKPSGG